MFQDLLNKVTKGARASEQASKAAYKSGEYYPTIAKEIPGLRGAYHRELNKLGVTFKETPVEATAALATRLVTDLTNDGTRGIYWRYNHPLAWVEAGAKKAIGTEAYKELGPTKTGLIGAAIVVPATALAGAYDITNPMEMFRPKGYAQSYAEEGSQDRRETSQPVPELFERFFLGRTGRPLKYETAKEDIPSLTPQRYANYMKSSYQDHGILGVIKGTTENLEGVPEARVLGYPITIPSVTSAVGGIVGAGAAIRSAPLVKNAFRRGLAGAVAGGAAGAIAGNLANAVLAAKPVENQLPTTAQYEMMQ